VNLDALADAIKKRESTGRRGFRWSTVCDGRAYGGCGAACLKFWKEAWGHAGAREDKRGRTLMAW
jgi:hypothetical protein